MYKIADYLHFNILKITIVLSGFISLYSQAPSFLGGLGQELAFYPLSVGIVIWLAGIILCQEKVYIPRAYSFYAFVFLLIWLFATGVANFPNMLESVFKGTTGITRFIVQYVSMMFYFLSALYIYNVFCKLALTRENVLLLFENVVILSSYIMGGYSLFEIASLLGMDYCREIVNAIDALFRSNDVQGDIFAYLRIRSLTMEASVFGMYCGIVMPWLVWRAFGKKTSPMKKVFNIAFFVYYIALIIFSTSRTAYFVVLIEFLVFTISYRKEIAKNWFSIGSRVLFFLLFIIACLMWVISSATVVEINMLDVLLSFTDSSNNVHELSNIARIGSQWAGWYMFLDNPFFGVGYGQYPFYYADYVPSWAWISQEVQFWGTNIPGSMVALSHGIYTRLLAEAGLIGFFVWLFILCSMLLDICKTDIFSGRKMCCSISIVALLLFGFNAESFRVFYYWVFLGIDWYIKSRCCDVLVNNKTGFET